MNNRKTKKAVDFQDYLKRKLRNPQFRKHYDEYGKQLEIAYQILQLRKQNGMSQAVLAKKIGTRQSNIARIETGKQNVSIAYLQRIASVLGKEFDVVFH